MKQCKKFKPYIRLANGRERTESLVMAYRVAFYQVRKRPFYVMVQRGFPKLVIAVGASRRDVLKQIPHIAYGHQSFKQWSASIQKSAVGRS